MSRVEEKPNMLHNTLSLPSVRRIVRDRIRRHIGDRLTGRVFPGSFCAGGPVSPTYSPCTLPYAANKVRRDATTDYLWSRIEAAGLVRLECRPDERAHYDDLVGDCYDECNAKYVPGGVRTLRAQERAFGRHLEYYGVHVLVGYYRLSTDDGWSVGDSLCGLVGDDSDASGYVTYIKAETIGSLVDELRSRCPVCRQSRH